jgi:hypothetical protein
MPEAHRHPELPQPLITGVAMAAGIKERCLSFRLLLLWIVCHSMRASRYKTRYITWHDKCILKQVKYIKKHDIVPAKPPKLQGV